MIVHARRGERSAEGRVPEGPAVDRLEPEAALGNLVVGPQQPDRHRLGLVQPVAAAQVAVAHGQLAEHGADHAVQVAAGGQVRQQGLIFSPHGLPVGAVHVRGIEFVPIDPPGFAEHLGPLGPGLDPDRDRAERRQGPVSLVELARVDDPADLAGAVEDLLVIRGEAEERRSHRPGFPPRGSSDRTGEATASPALPRPGRAASRSVGCSRSAPRCRPAARPEIKPGSTGKATIRWAIPSRSIDDRRDRLGCRGVLRARCRLGGRSVGRPGFVGSWLFLAASCESSFLGSFFDSSAFASSFALSVPPAVSSSLSLSSGLGVDFWSVTR